MTSTQARITYVPIDRGAPLSPTISPAQSAAAAIYQATVGGVSGAGTDEDALFSALSGQSPAELDALRAAYSAHYQRNLDRDVLGELQGMPRERAQALLLGDQAGADAIELDRAMHGGPVGIWADEDAIFRTLEGKDNGALADLRSAYLSRTEGPGLRADLAASLSGDAKTRALALLAGDGATADAAKLHQAMKGGYTGIGADGDSIEETLRQAPDASAIAQSYGRLYGTGSSDPLLRAHLSDELSGPERDRALALLDQDRPAADAAGLRAAMKGGWTGLGVDTNAVTDTFEGRSDRDRQAIVSAYEKKYGLGAGGPGLSKDLAGELSAPALEKTQRLVESGRLSDAEALHFAISGAQGEGPSAPEILRGKTREELRAIRDDYSARYGGDLGADLEGALSGREAFDARQAMKGAPTTPEEALERAQEARDYERGGWSNAISQSVMDAVSPSAGQNLEGSLAAAKQTVLQAEKSGR